MSRVFVRDRDGPWVPAACLSVDRREAIRPRSYRRYDGPKAAWHRRPRQCVLIQRKQTNRNKEAIKYAILVFAVRRAPRAQHLHIDPTPHSSMGRSLRQT